MNIFIRIVVGMARTAGGWQVLLVILFGVAMLCGGIIYLVAGVVLEPVGNEYRTIRHEVYQQIAAGNPPVELEVSRGKCDLQEICGLTNNEQELLTLSVKNTLKFNVYTSNLQFQIYEVDYSDGTTATCSNGLNKDIDAGRRRTLYCSHVLQNLAKSDQSNQVCLHIMFPTFRDTLDGYRIEFCQEIPPS